MPRLYVYLSCATTPQEVECQDTVYPDTTTKLTEPNGIVGEDGTTVVATGDGRQPKTLSLEEQEDFLTWEVQWIKAQLRNEEGMADDAPDRYTCESVA